MTGPFEPDLGQDSGHPRPQASGLCGPAAAPGPVPAVRVQCLFTPGLWSPRPQTSGLCGPAATLPPLPAVPESRAPLPLGVVNYPQIPIFVTKETASGPVKRKCSSMPNLPFPFTLLNFPNHELTLFVKTSTSLLMPIAPSFLHYYN